MPCVPQLEATADRTRPAQVTRAEPLDRFPELDARRGEPNRSEDRAERLGAVDQPQPGDAGVGLREGQLLGQVADVVRDAGSGARPSVERTPIALPSALTNAGAGVAGDARA